MSDASKILHAVRVCGGKDNRAKYDLTLFGSILSDLSKATIDKCVLDLLDTGYLSRVGEDCLKVTSKGTRHLDKKTLIAMHNKLKGLKKMSTEKTAKKTTPEKEATAKKVATKKTPTKKAPVKKAAAKKAPTKKVAAAKKTPTKKAATKKAPAKKAPVRKDVKKPERKHRAGSVVRNGIVKPKPTSKIGQVWATIDKMRGRKKNMPPSKEISAKHGSMARGTVSVAIHLYKKHHGL